MKKVKSISRDAPPTLARISKQPLLRSCIGPTFHQCHYTCKCTPGTQIGYIVGMSNTTNQSATERADALLTRWGQCLSQSEKQTPPPVAETAPETDGRGLVGMAARVYVALAAKAGEIVTPVVKTWQESVDEARREQERKAAQTPGAPSAQKDGTDEKEGEKVLGETAGVAADAASTATGA